MKVSIYLSVKGHRGAMKKIILYKLRKEQFLDPSIRLNVRDISLKKKHLEIQFQPI